MVKLNTSSLVGWVPVAEVAEQFGIPQTLLLALVKREGWSGRESDGCHYISNNVDVLAELVRVLTGQEVSDENDEDSFDEDDFEGSPSAIREGLLVMRNVPTTGPDGTVTTKRRIFITGKGMATFAAELKQLDALS